jgi:hypothetical protein
MLYLLRATGFGNVLTFSSEGCLREEALRALAFIAIPVARTGGTREDFTRGDDGTGAMVDVRGVGIGFGRGAGRVDALIGGGWVRETEAALVVVLLAATPIDALRAFSIIGMIVFLEAGLRLATRSEISAKPMADTRRGNKACAAFLTSALRSSTDASITGIKGERSNA